MVEFLDLVEIPGEGTFFCTQQYDVLERSRHELAPHPLLPAEESWAGRLEAARSLFPRATGWRSHSCVFSHLLALQLSQLGYRYASTHDEFGRQAPRPHRLAWGLWHMPIYYMDTLDFSASQFWDGYDHQPFGRELIERALASDGVYVFDFHPIHLLLDSEVPIPLPKREAFVAGTPLSELSDREESRGTRRFYDELCAAMAAVSVESRGMQEALDAWSAGE
jgi:hypothetical protein